MVLIEHNRKYLQTSGALRHKLANVASPGAAPPCATTMHQQQIQMQPQQQPPHQLTTRLLVLGHKGVGKSASIVRYTTGRFIHHYSESTCDWLYRQTLSSPKYHLNRENNKFSNTINQLGQVSSILPNCIELLEQKDIQFSSASNFMAQSTHIQQQKQQLQCDPTSPQAMRNNTSDPIEESTVELNESLLFSSRVALDQKIDNELHEKQKLLNKLCWANAYIVIYAINDVSTFNKAIKYLNLIANNINSPLDNQRTLGGAAACKSNKQTKSPHSNSSTNTNSSGISSSSNGSSSSSSRNKQSNHSMSSNSAATNGAHTGRKTKAASFLRGVSPYHSSSAPSPTCGGGGVTASAPLNGGHACAADRSALVRPRRPILLLGNKLDLDSAATRQVSANEGRRLALRHQTLFAEVSIAESAEQLVSIFFDLVRQVDPLSYHLSELQALFGQPNGVGGDTRGSAESTTICQWRPEVADGPVFGNIVKSKQRYFTSIARSCRASASSLDGYPHQAMVARPLSARPPKSGGGAAPTRTLGGGGGESKSGASGGGGGGGGAKLDFKASFKKASMAIVGSRAMARQAASKSARKTSSTEQLPARAAEPSSSETLDRLGQHSQWAPMGGQQVYLSGGSGRNSCDSTNSISAASSSFGASNGSGASSKSKSRARLSTSSASSAAASTTTTTTTTSTSTNWFGWASIKSADHNKAAGSGAQCPTSSAGGQSCGRPIADASQTHQSGHRRSESVASASPMSLSSPSSSTTATTTASDEPAKLSSSSMVLCTLSASSESRGEDATKGSSSSAERLAEVVVGSQQPHLQAQHNLSGGGGGGTGSGFGSRFKRPLFKYKSRRKTVAFEPATLLGADSASTGTALAVAGTGSGPNIADPSALAALASSTDAVCNPRSAARARDAHDNMIRSCTRSPSTSLHNVSSTLGNSCKNITNSYSDVVGCYGVNAHQTNGTQIRHTKPTSAPLSAIAWLADAQSSLDAQVTRCATIDRQYQQDEDSAKSSGRSSASFSSATLPSATATLKTSTATPTPRTTTTTTTSASDTYHGSYYVLCEPEQVAPMNTCPTGVCPKETCPRRASSADNNNKTNAASEQVYANATGANNNNTTQYANGAYNTPTNVNKTGTPTNGAYVSRKSSRSTLSRASTSGGSHEIDDSADDSSASSSCGSATQAKLKGSKVCVSDERVSITSCNNTANVFRSPQPPSVGVGVGAAVATANVKTHKAPQLQKAACAPPTATVVRHGKQSGGTGIHLVKSVQSTLNNFTRSSSTTAQVAKKSFCHALTKYLNSPSESANVAKSTAAIPAASMALVATDLVRSSRNNNNNNNGKSNQQQQQQGQYRVLSH